MTFTKEIMDDLRDLGEATFSAGECEVVGEDETSFDVKVTLYNNGGFKIYVPKDVDHWEV